jgi:hypothetical protein
MACLEIRRVEFINQEQKWMEIIAIFVAKVEELGNCSAQ